MFKGGVGNLMKQAQMMQENMKRVQAELANVEVEGSAGNGLVKITMTCRNEVKRVAIDDSVMDDRETLEDLLVVAFKDALSQAEKPSESRMASLMPPGMKMPF